MSRRNSWGFGSLAACLLLSAACGSSDDTGTDDQSQTPQTPSAGTGTSTAGKTGGTAGAKATAGTSSSAGASGGSAGAGASVTAAAVIEPFMMPGAASGAAGSAAGAGASGSSASAGTSGAAGKAGSGAAGSSAGAGGSGKAAAGSGGKSGAAGTGSGSGVTGVTGKATFSKAKIGIDLVIDISAGCETGKSYPVHIHEGTSCESVATQMGHWGAPPAPAAGAAGAAAAGSGSAGTGAAGAAGHDASHDAAAGSSGAAAGAGAAGSGTALIYRGEDIPPITCSGITGKSSTTRSTPDKRLVWNIGTMDETDVIGHVLVVHDVDNSRIGCGKIEKE